MVELRNLKLLLKIGNENLFYESPDGKLLMKKYGESKDKWLLFDCPPDSLNKLKAGDIPPEEFINLCKVHLICWNENPEEPPQILKENIELTPEDIIHAMNYLLHLLPR
jgi:hypothetical protein